MKLSTNHITINRSENFKEFTYSISEEGLPFIMNILRNQLYSDPISACIREISVNAVDSHIVSGKPKLPIEVSLPSNYDKNLKIRDYGTGLSEQEIEDLYAVYGESTKRNSNKLTGMLGIGKVSAFSYSDSFMIVSYFNGTKFTYSAYIDESQLGKIAKLDEEPTKEINGVEIIIPVKDNDIYSFADKARKIFSYFIVKPTIKGTQLTYNDKTPVFTDDNWKFYGSSMESVVVMGNVAYPINTELLDLPDYNTKQLLSYGLELTVPIGKVDIAASREALHYTDKTKKFVVNEISKVVSFLGKHTEKVIDEQKSYWAALVFFNTFNDIPCATTIKAITSNIKFNYKGMELQKSGFNFNKYIVENKLALRGFSYSASKSNGVNAYDCTSIAVAANTVLVINDLNITNKLAAYFYNFVQSNKNAFLFTFKDKAAQDSILKELNLSDAPFVLLSTVPKADLTSNYNHDVKHTKKVFQLDLNYYKNKVNSYSYRYRSFSNSYWNIVDLDLNAGGVYVYIDRFDSVNMGSPKNICEYIELAKKIGIKVPEVYGFKQSVCERDKKIINSSKWINLKDYLDKEIKAVLGKDGMQLYVDNLNMNSSWYGMLDYIKLEKVDNQNNIICELLNYKTDLKQRLKATDINAISSFISLLQIPITGIPTKDISKLFKNVYSLYPMLQYIDGLCKISNGSNLSDYVNLVDKSLDKPTN